MAPSAAFWAGMKLVRLYIAQDNRGWHEDIAYSHYQERLAELEMDGADVYMAKILPPKRRQRTHNVRTGPVAHLYG
jgi:PII-like signaling protein